MQALVEKQDDRGSVKETMPQPFTITSLNCVCLTSAAELCADIEAIGADVYCLQNCIESKLKALPMSLGRKSMSGSTVLIRTSVFDFEQHASVNLLEEVLRRSDTIPAYRDCLPRSLGNLLYGNQSVFICQIRHIATGNCLIVVTGDFSPPSHLKSDFSEDNDLSPQLRTAMCVELQRVLWQTQKPGLCTSWKCPRVVVAGGLVGFAGSVAYLTLGSSHLLGQAAPNVLLPTIAVTTVRKPPVSLSSDPTYTCTFTVAASLLTVRLDCAIVGFELKSDMVDEAFLEAGQYVRADGTAVWSDDTVSFRPLNACRLPEEGGRRWSLKSPFPTLEHCPLLLRLTWSTKEQRLLSVQELGFSVLHGESSLLDARAPADLSAAPPNRPASLRSALAGSLSAAETEQDVETLKQEYLLDPFASSALAEYLDSLCCVGGDWSWLGEPVATVSDLDRKQREARMKSTSLQRFRTGCTNFIFYTNDNGLQLIEAKKLRARDVLAPTSTIHKPVTCQLAFCHC